MGPWSSLVRRTLGATLLHHHPLSTETLTGHSCLFSYAKKNEAAASSTSSQNTVPKFSDKSRVLSPYQLPYRHPSPGHDVFQKQP